MKMKEEDEEEEGRKEGQYCGIFQRIGGVQKFNYPLFNKPLVLETSRKDQSGGPLSPVSHVPTS